MLKITSLVYIFTIILLTSFSCKAVANEDCYILTQRSQSIGDLYLYVCKDGLKFFVPKRNFGMVSRAPNWQINLFNESTKKYFQTTMEKYAGNTAGKIVSFKGYDNIGRKWQTRKKAVICNYSAQEYCLENLSNNDSISNIRNRKINNSNIHEIDYWVSDQISISDKIAEMLSKFYGLPNIKYLPLRLNYINTKNELTNVLNTYRITKTQAPISYFNSPNGYQLVTNESEVLLDNDSQQMLKDLANDLGTTDPSLANTLSKKIK